LITRRRESYADAQFNALAISVPNSQDWGAWPALIAVAAGRALPRIDRVFPAAEARGGIRLPGAARQVRESLLDFG
jgi:hypothetical protein